MSAGLHTEFAEFIENYYVDELVGLVDSDENVLRVSWRDLYRHDPDLADDYLSSPEKLHKDLLRGVVDAELPPAKEGVLDAAINREDIEVRVVDLGEKVTHIRNLRRERVGEYVGLDVQIATRTQVSPRIDEATFECVICDSLEDMHVSGEELQPPEVCPVCERKGVMDLSDAHTTYEDHQLIEIEDPPAESAGRSDSLTVHAFDDVAGRVEAGDRVTVYGTLETKPMTDERNPSRRRPLQLTATEIETDKTGFDDMTPERIDEIQKLSDRGDLYELLVGSIAPHILTDEKGDTIKLSLALQLFGGVERNMQTGYKRGNINILLIGTPGTAKSQYLNAVNKIAPKGVKVSGKNAKPAGMTATATRSEQTGEWTLKAGALVKASGGIACIDEFDKMQSQTKSSLHEALEDQEISVAKADINTTLPAKASVLAAANPKTGVFNRFEPLAEQIEIGQTIISRFDLIYGLQDLVDEQKDREIAKHQHQSADPERDDPEPAIDLDLLTEYVAYARQNVFPSYESEAVENELVEYYVDLRQKSNSDGDDNVRPVGARVNELLRRLSQASARARLSDTITMSDVERVKMLFDRTIGEVGLDDEGNISGAMLDGGESVQADRMERLKDALPGKNDEPMTAGEIAENADISESWAEQRLQKLAEGKGTVIRPKNGVFRSV